MSKKTDELNRSIESIYAEQSAIYQDILSQVIDPLLVVRMLRQLEANTVRRLNAQRELDKEMSKPTGWSALFANQ